MEGIASISGMARGLAAVEFAAQYQVAVLKKQIEVIEEMGELALRLIQSVPRIDPEVGAHLDVIV